MVDIRIKKMFFDRPKVQRAVDAARQRVLSKAGAFVRKEARWSIKSRKKMVSRPGHPPFSHVGLLKRFIFFGYDEYSDSVVVGPVGFKRSNVPHVLEYGGVTTVTRFRRGKIEQRRVRIAPRPYMGPALAKELPKFPELWRNSIREG